MAGTLMKKGMRGAITAVSGDDDLTMHSFNIGVGLVRSFRRSDVQPLKGVCANCMGKGYMSQMSGTAIVCPTCAGAGSVDAHVIAAAKAERAAAEAAAVAPPPRPTLHLLNGPDSEKKALDRFFDTVFDVSDAVSRDVMDSNLQLSASELQRQAIELNAKYGHALQAGNVQQLSRRRGCWRFRSSV